MTCDPIWAIYGSIPTGEISLSALEARADSPFNDLPVQQATVAVIPVTGALYGRSNWYSGDMNSIKKMMDEALKSSALHTMIFDFHSPGGTVAGLPELADKIKNIPSTIKTIGIVNHLAASAAYWLASQTQKLYISAGGMLGSIGVRMTHVDYSKALTMAGIKVTEITTSPNKAEGSPHSPLTERDKERFMQQAQQYHEMFVDAVARGRGVSAATVNSQFGQGGLLTAKEAIAVGAADGIDDLDSLIEDAMKRDADTRRRDMRMAQVKAAATKLRDS